MKAFEYASSRPIDALPLPPLARRRVRRMTWRWRHGVVAFPRPLTDNEMSEYGLMPVSKHDPDIIGLARFMFETRLRSDIVRKRIFHQRLGGGRHLSVKRREYDSDFEVSVLTSSDRLVGEMKIIRDLDEVWDMLTPHAKDLWLEEADPGM